jgi:UDP-N-acetylmuramoyl-tripeptide--D-alanyl-D-alanine ligase
MATPIPDNDARLSLADILRATGGRLSGRVADEAIEIAGVSTDTRQLRPGQLFVALRGDRFDGHDHLAAAAQAGAALAIVDRDVKPPLTAVRVPDTLDALGALAALHLERWRRRDARRRVIAITGSAGKTTTRQAIAALLAEASDPAQIHASAGNLNNRVGVPMTLFALADGHRHAVIELGTNRAGEIGKLARMVKPDVALITLIAAAHAEGLGDLEAIAREKLSLLSALEGLAVGNADDARVAAALARCERRLTYGYGEADYRIVARQVIDADRSRLRIACPAGELEADIALIGSAGALACAAAVAVVEALLDRQLDASTVTRALAAIARDGRLHPRHSADGLVVLDDSYNANPASCRASIQAAREIAEALARRLILVLGEMRELGAVSAEAHDELGRLVAESGAALVIAVAGDARRTAEQASRAGMRAAFCEDAAEAAALAAREVAPDDVVLVKGSRGVRTEQVVTTLLQGELAG